MAAAAEAAAARDKSLGQADGSSTPAAPEEQPDGGGGSSNSSQTAVGSAASLLQQQPASSGIRMGVTSYSPPVAALAPGGAADPEGLVLAPSGVAFLPQSVRPGVLPRLLHEILATRVMVKAAMKRSKADKVRCEGSQSRHRSC
jgi:hypothetical protein